MDLFKSFHNPDASLGSSSFDLSCRRVYSSNAGELIPALVLDTVPGDKFKINMQAMMRSQTMDTAAFVRGKFNYDFFFVPYQQIWHRYLEFVNQRADVHSSSLPYSNNGLAPVSTPTISLYRLIKTILEADGQVDSYSAQDLGTYFNGRYAFRLLNMLGYGNYEYLLDLYNDDDQSALSELDKLTHSYARADGTSTQVFINPFRLCAYQHIWYDIYRNKDYDLAGIGVPYVDAFSLDDVDCSTIANARMSISDDYTNNARFYEMCKLHHCQWKKDIYTSVVPSQQFGVVSAIDVVTPTGVASNGTTLSGQRTLYLYDNTLGSTVNNNRVDINLNGSFDVLQLRRAEAMQKWKESAMRAGNMSNKNQRAHFGVEPYYYEENTVHFLGSFDGSFQVNPVTSQSDNGAQGNQPLGSLAATGTSVVANGHDIEFDCRDYGIIMCISRFVPESEYNATGIEKANSRFEPFDYYNPEFANLGLQAVPLIEQDNNAQIYRDKNFVLGYAPRDYDYKQNVDKVYGDFMNYLVAFNSSNRSYGSLSGWVSPRREDLVSINEGAPQGRSKSSFYVNPAILNSVFLVSMSNAPQFIHQCWFDVKAIRKMPVLGLPQY